MSTTPSPARFTVDGHRLEASPLPPGLHVVATPIGHLGDVTLRALATLAAADTILCEDTRVTSKLLQRYGIRGRLKAYHDHNAAKLRPGLLADLERGARIALVSDAGMPLVSDPGYKLVKEALDQGIAVDVVPGPSAVLTALVLSGLPPDRFLFLGFLPARAGARRAALEAVKTVPASLVCFESAARIEDTLADLAELLGPRPLAVTRELTKLHQEALRGTAEEVAAAISARGGIRGEVTVVVGPPQEEPASDSEVDAALTGLLATMSVSQAASEAARRFGRPRRELYARLQAMKDAR